MWTLRLTLVLVLATCIYATKKDAESEKKTLIMLELEPIVKDERIRRSSDGPRGSRQIPPQVPQDYLGLLQQLAAQRQEQPGQQHLIQQLVVSPDGQQPSAVRYVLSQDGRLIEQSSLLQQQQQQQQQQQFLQQQLQPQPPASPAQQNLSPELAAFSRFQQQAQQAVREQPIREQIAGPRQRPPRPQPTQPQELGPQISQLGPQVFSPASNQAVARHQERLRQSLTSGPVSIGGFQPSADPQYLIQQQLAQYAAEAQQQAPQSQLANLPPQFQAQIYQQQQAQLQAQQQQQAQLQAQQQRQSERLVYQPQQQPNQARPSAPPQEQYLIETTRAQPNAPQFVSYTPPQPTPEAQSQQQPQQVQYIDLRTGAPIPAPQPQYIFTRGESKPDQESPFSQQLLQPTPGRGIFNPRGTARPTPSSPVPSRSSIYVSKTGTKPTRLPVPTIEEFINQQPQASNEKLPLVRIPSNNQRPLSQAELEALVNAGFTVTPLQNQEEALFQKSKRQQPRTQKNHVTYHNQQEGVQYQYSPGGSSSAEVTDTAQPQKQVVYVDGRKRLTKKKPIQYIYTNENNVRNLYKLDGRNPGKDVVTYVLAVDGKQQQQLQQQQLQQQLQQQQQAELESRPTHSRNE